jgi:hypothetical protein
VKKSTGALIAGLRNRRTSVDCKDEAWFKQAEELKLESQELPSARYQSAFL